MQQSTCHGGDVLAEKKICEKYRCNVYGNELNVTKVGGGILVSFGQKMELISYTSQKKKKR
jgi:hypothetical protein